MPYIVPSDIARIGDIEEQLDVSDKPRNHSPQQGNGFLIEWYNRWMIDTVHDKAGLRWQVCSTTTLKSLSFHLFDTCPDKTWRKYMVWFTNKHYKQLIAGAVLPDWDELRNGERARRFCQGCTDPGAWTDDGQGHITRTCPQDCEDFTVSVADDIKNHVSRTRFNDMLDAEFSKFEKLIRPEALPEYDPPWLKNRPSQKDTILTTQVGNLDIPL